MPWARKTVLPRITAMGLDSAYLKRLTALLTINVCVILSFIPPPPLSHSPFCWSKFYPDCVLFSLSLSLSLFPSHTFSCYIIVHSSVQAVADLIDGDTVGRELSSTLTSLGRDPVPNVRLNVARTVEKLLPKADASWVNARLIYLPFFTCSSFTIITIISIIFTFT